MTEKVTALTYAGFNCVSGIEFRDADGKAVALFYYDGDGNAPEASLFVAARKACATLNPSNPLAVAEGIEPLVSAAQAVIDTHKSLAARLEQGEDLTENDDAFELWDKAVCDLALVLARIAKGETG